MRDDVGGRLRLSILDHTPVSSGSTLGEAFWHWVLGETGEAAHEIATARSLSMVELKIAWLLSEPAVASVIAGATSAEQVAQNAAAAGKQLSALDRMELDQLLGRSAAVALSYVVPCKRTPARFTGPSEVLIITQSHLSCVGADSGLSRRAEQSKRTG
jgi:hypothetical protein